MTIHKPPLPSGSLANARRLRRAMTDAEHKLWRHLRSGQFDGLKFRRQHPIPPYIVDFCCLTNKLIVELDGSQHNEQVDARRSKFLESQGWRILRFWDNDALNRTEAVLEAIWNEIEHPNPHPSPLPEGEGAKADAPLPEGEGAKAGALKAPLPSGEGLG